MGSCGMPGIEGDEQCKRRQMNRDEKISERVARKEVSCGGHLRQ